MTDDNLANIIRNQGWKQGSVLDLPAVYKLLGADCEYNIAVILSQDCDIVQPNLEVEPDVEILLGKMANFANPIFEHGRNPRKLHVKFENTKQVATFQIRSRKYINKHDLSCIQPSNTYLFTESQKRILVHWIAKRYTRPAFPDTFNNRLRKIGRKLDQLVKKEYGKAVTSIFVSIEPANEELSEEESYDLFVWVAYRDETQLYKINKFEEELLALLRKCSGINLIEEECEAHHHRDITLEDLEELRRWDYEYRSIINDGQLLDTDE